MRLNSPSPSNIASVVAQSSGGGKTAAEVRRTTTPGRRRCRAADVPVGLVYHSGTKQGTCRLTKG
ncbi:hypothetical protein IG631_20421 [Alternaria alternata]|nr:hypothetical protein IG631_20421 [Alternaria alternata]